MHKKRKNRIKLLSILAFIVLLGPLTWIVYGNDEKDISYSIHEEVTGEVATITLEIVASDKVEEITGIKMPEGSMHEAKNIVTYEVRENGEYTFVVYYRVVKGEEREVLEKEEEITYQVSSIEEKQDEISPNETVPVEEAPEEAGIHRSEELENEAKPYAAGDISINETTFPDVNFRNWVLSQSYGTDKVLSVSEIANVKTMNVSSKNISSLQGIEYFTSLTELYCSGNKLSNLNLRSNGLLTILNCEYNQLAEQVYVPSSLTTFYGSRQSRTIKMYLRSGIWTNVEEYFYYISSIGNSNIRYFYKNGRFESTSTSNTSSSFNTIVDYSKNMKLDGYLTFEYVDDYVEVTNITGVPSNIIIGTTVTLNGTVVPSNTTDKNIHWSVKDDGYTGATIRAKQLTTQRIGKGTVTVTATVDWGLKTGAYTKDFSIKVDYADPSSLSCTFEGTVGKNGWYISDVMAVAPNGYEITRKLDTYYSDSLPMTENLAMMVYFRNKTTGAIYSGKAIGPVKVDKSDPTITGITNEGSEITSSNKTVTVSDVNLSSVLLYTADTSAGLSTATAVTQTITNGTSTVALRAANKDQYFKIVAEDLSGRTTIYTYTLLHPTYSITVANLTFDAVEYNYSSVTGKKLNINYQANGANSEASITSIVPSDTNKFTVSGSGKDWTVTPKTGLNAGVHTVTLTATYTGGKTTTSTVSMVVNKTNNSFTIVQADITYGGTVNPSASGIKENARVNYTYKVKGTADNTYTTTKPTNAGQYTIRGISEVTANYNSATVTKNFIIAKASNPFTITQVDILYGETIHPTVSNLKENANLTYYYKLVSANDDAYTSTIPTAPGNYNIKAISSETANYKTTEYITSFFIQYQLTASNACITIDEAKGITTANDLKTYNQADSNPTGITNQISVGCTNLSSIQSGTPGNYEVKYTLLDITTTVKIQVVEAGYAVSEDRQTGFYGKDSKLTKEEASTITKEELLNQLEVKVITATGMLYEDTSKFMIDMDSIHNASVGNNTIRIGFKEGNIDIEREVTIEILDDNPSAMISLPASIELERVLHNETFEAVKEEKVEILSTVDTEIYSKDFYIRTEPSITITNTEDSKEKFTVQIYDGKENKLTSKETPIAILNGTTKSQKFFVKAYKDLARQRGMYQGTMNFEIGYGEGQ